MMCVLSWIVGAVVSLAASLSLYAQAPAADLNALAAAISKADEQFCQAVADRNIEGFRSLVGENATFVTATGSEEHGRDAIAKAWGPYFEPDGATLTWRPEKAEVLPGGEVGYTSGRFEGKSKTRDGRVMVSRGHYLTIWRKHADGPWQVAYDTGTTLETRPEQSSR